MKISKIILKHVSANEIILFLSVDWVLIYEQIKTNQILIKTTLEKYWFTAKYNLSWSVRGVLNTNIIWAK